MKQGGTAGEFLEFYPSLTDREYLSGTFFYSSMTSTKLYCGKTLIIVDKEDENEKNFNNTINIFRSFNDFFM